jgi:hypothetical protein
MALKTLGYRVTGPNGINDQNIDKNIHSIAKSLVREYDAFKDNPWPIIFKEMDAMHPNSKFLLTVRDSESWIKSQVRHFGRHETPMRKWIYGVGCPEGNEGTYIKRLEEHNKEVIDYFKDRPDDLLVFDLAKGDGWEKLCPFLKADIPNIPFPHANKASDRETRSEGSTQLYRLVRKIKDLAKHIH